MTDKQLLHESTLLNKSNTNLKAIKKILLWFCLLANYAQAQPQITWQKYFFMSIGSTYISTITQLKDSGYLFFSYDVAPSINKKLIRTNKYGDTIVTKPYQIYAFNIIKTFDDGFLLSGVENGISKIVKLNSNLDTLWSKSFPTQTYGFAIQTRDSGYVLVRQNEVIKTDSLGNMIWQHYGFGYYSVLECFNGDLLATGRSYASIYAATLLDSSGNLKWNKEYADFTISGGANFHLYEAVQLPDSNFVVVANNWKTPFYLTCGGFDLAKISKNNGDTIWAKNYQNLALFSDLTSLSLTKDSNIIFSNDFDLTKTDLQGNMIWTKNTNVYINKLITCNDGGYAVVGISVHQGSNIWATYAKLDSLGNSYNFQGIPSIAVNELRVYPNPAFNQLAISSEQLANEQEVTVTIYDMPGKIQLQQKIISQGDFKVDVNALPSGMFMLQLKQEGRLFNGRFLKD